MDVNVLGGLTIEKVKGRIEGVSYQNEKDGQLSVDNTNEITPNKYLQQLDDIL